MRGSNVLLQYSLWRYGLPPEAPQKRPRSAPLLRGLFVYWRPKALFFRGPLRHLAELEVTARLAMEDKYIPALHSADAAAERLVRTRTAARAGIVLLG